MTKFTLKFVTSSFSSLLRRLLAPLLGLIIGLVIALIMVFFFNENPWKVLQVLSTSFLQSKFDLGLTLFYTTCFIFSGLAFAIPLRAGLFHIGAEGQILISALVAAALGNSLNVENPAGILLIVLASLFSGILASLIIGWMKYFRNSHEVVVAIMLNFILAAFASYITLNFFQNPDSQNPETALIKPEYQIMKDDWLKIYFDQSPVSSFFIVSILFCILLYVLEKKSLFFKIINGYGLNPSAAERVGFSKFKIITVVMTLAGTFSAFLGLTEILGNTYQYKIGFSPQYGFLGIGVALLARLNFLGIMASAFLLAILHKGASDLDMETQFLTRDYSRVIQALIIFSIAISFYLFRKRKK